MRYVVGSVLALMAGCWARRMMLERAIMEFHELASAQAQTLRAVREYADDLSVHAFRESLESGDLEDSVISSQALDAIGGQLRNILGVG